MNLRKTPLYNNHLQSHGRIVDFAGWEMPVQYSGLVDEHHCVRKAVGLFDVSHMGEIVVTGRGALSFLQEMTTNDVSKLVEGQAQYSALCYENGTLVDDIVIYRRGADSFFICVNASNKDKDFKWLANHQPKSGVVLEDLSDQYAQIAIQGPKARELLASAVDFQIQNLKYYHFNEGKVFGVPSLVARTGYTGELGYEIYIPAQSASMVWNGLMEMGQKFDIKPCGLGARDTLRLEVGYLLYGNDMDDTTNALECGLGWITKFDKKENFIGREALQKVKQAGVSRKLVGLELVEKGVLRHDYKLFADASASESIGKVTSGTFSPTLQKSVALAYVPTKLSDLGTEVMVEIRNDRKKAVVVKKPFFTQGTANS